MRLHQFASSRWDTGSITVSGSPISQDIDIGVEATIQPAEETGAQPIPAQAPKKMTYADICCDTYVLNRSTFAFSHGMVNGWNLGPLRLVSLSEARASCTGWISSKEVRSACP